MSRSRIAISVFVVATGVLVLVGLCGARAEMLNIRSGESEGTGGEAADASGDGQPIWHAHEASLVYGAGLKWSDSVPSEAGAPCEIFEMILEYEKILDYGVFVPGQFTFEIQTNFGDRAHRTAWDNSSYGITLNDSYGPAPGLVNFAAGDLYILVRDKQTAENKRLYGLVLETRTGTDSDPWHGALDAAGYNYEAKSAGQLYEVPLTQDRSTTGFATGTTEWYVESINWEFPDMGQAQFLPGLVDASAERLQNAYPTLLLGGELVDTGSAGWEATHGWESSDPDPATTPRGKWSGSFILPDYDPDTEYVQVWWAMHGGNDAVMVVTCFSAIWPAFEPSLAYGAWPKWNDSVPTEAGYPCEIFETMLGYGVFVPGQFTFEIQTNFGDRAHRTAWDNSSYGIELNDSYGPAPGLVNFAAGDLYILVGNRYGNDNTGLYGLVLETRTGTDSDPWHGALAAAGYTYGAKSAGQLYEGSLTQDWSTTGFATGTTEWYVESIDQEVPYHFPGMEWAQRLPGLVYSFAGDHLNAYPTLLLGGEFVGTGSARWEATHGWESSDPDPSTTPRGKWSGSFILPDYDPDTERVEVWWAMHGGNDAVLVSTVFGGSDPLPADANGDCIVNILDMIFVRNRLNKDVASGDNRAADTNNDGSINILDMIFIRNHLGDICGD